jgi:hypothetical protein
MNNKSLVKDCVSVCGWIEKCLRPGEFWTVVNLAQVGQDLFSFHEYPEYRGIKTGFGFFFDSTPEALMDAGVIEAKSKNRWFEGFTQRGLDPFDFDVLTKKSRERGYIEKDEVIIFYDDRAGENPVVPESVPEWQYTRNQCAALINVENLRSYIKIHTNLSPKIVDNSLIYLGREQKLNSHQYLDVLKILINNIGSIVSYKDLGDVISDGNKKTLREIRDVINNAQKSFKKESLFGETIIITEQRKMDGWGMFVNDKAVKNYIKRGEQSSLPHNQD